MTFWKKTGHILFALLPLLIVFGLQTLIMIPFLGLSGAYAFHVCQLQGYTDMDHIFNYAYDIWMGVSFNSAFYLVFSTTIILSFGYWYITKFVTKETSSKKHLRKLSNPWIFLGIFILSIALQYVSSFVMNITAAVNPDWLTTFEEIQNSLNMDHMTFGLTLYAVFLGPINEELIFRGVTLCYAKKAMPFWIANIFQAVLFGAYHMNMIQGCYAFVIGLFLGYVCEKGGSILFSMLLHIVYNFFASYGSEIFFHGRSEVLYYVWLGMAILLPVIGILIYNHGVKKRTAINAVPTTEI